MENQQNPNPKLHLIGKILKGKRVLPASKGYAFLIQKNGSDGMPGVSPSAPPPQRDGRNGTASYPDGENGSPGINGNHGTNGTNGSSASDVSVLLSGVPTNLLLRIDHGKTVGLNMETQQNQDKVILVEAIGGKGGNGGSGSNGGRPGNGGDGWTPPHDSSKPPGRGGNGGDGANGGSAGFPGNGGNGGNITVCSPDPRLFVFVQTRNNGGRSGKLGKPGLGSKGGAAGRARNYSLAGANGRGGVDGTKSQPGQNGRDGKTMFQILDQIGNVVETGQKPFLPIIQSFDVNVYDDDGIIEPGECLILNNFVVENTGDLSLPQGCLLYVQGQHVDIEGMIELPSIPPGQRVTVHKEIIVRIHEDFEVTDFSKPFSHQLSLEARITCLGRDFEISSIKGKITVQNPVKIGNILTPRCAERGQNVSMSIFITNISHHPFGKNFSNDVSFKVELPEYLKCTSKSGAIDGSCSHIPPNQQWDTEVTLYMDKEAVFFKDEVYILKLFLRGKLIEERSGIIKCAPQFDPGNVNESDVLFITSSLMTDQEYWAYNSVFRFLKFTVNHWDIDLQQGLSVNNLGMKHRPTWVDKFGNKLIVFPLNIIGEDTPEVVIQFIASLMHPKDLLNHYLPDSNSLSKSGVLFVHYGKHENFPTKRRFFKYLATKDDIVKEMRQKDFEQNYRLSNPTESDFESIVAEVERKYDSKNPLYFHYLDASYNIEKLSSSWLRGTLYQMSSGGLVHRIGLSRLDRFLYCTINKDAFKNPKHIDHKFSLHDDERFQLLAGILCGLSIEAKFNLLNNLKNSDIKNISGSNGEYTMIDLVAVNLATDLAREFHIHHKRIRSKLMASLLKDKFLTYSCVYAFIISHKLKANRSWMETMTPTFVSSSKKLKKKLTTTLDDVLADLKKIESNDFNGLPNISQCVAECESKFDKLQELYQEYKKVTTHQYIL